MDKQTAKEQTIPILHVEPDFQSAEEQEHRMTEICSRIREILAGIDRETNTIGTD